MSYVDTFSLVLTQRKKLIAKPWGFFTASINLSTSMLMPAIINIHGSRALHNEGSSAPRCVAHSHCAQCILLLYSLPERIERNMSHCTARHCFLCEYCSWFPCNRLEQYGAARRSAAQYGAALLKQYCFCNDHRWCSIKTRILAFTTFPVTEMLLYI